MLSFSRSTMPRTRPPTRRAAWALRLVLSLILLLGGASLVSSKLVGGGPPFDEVAQSGFARFTYYRVTRIDPRFCPAPHCGGFFVERVNRKRMKCANGEFVKECHAAVVDFSRLGLGSAEEVELLNDFGSQRLLARGELVERVFGSGPPVPTLVVDDAWRGATGTQGDWGSYWATIPSGITCFTFPCPTLYRFKINAPRVGWLHSIDLNHAGATQSQIDDALTDLYQGPGLIGFGKMKTIVGPAGKGREFRPSEFYTKVDERASIQCGGFTYPPNPACGFGEFCESPEGTCFIADLPGTCQSVPTLCPLAIIPVCGCDGNTYGNDCERQQAQVALDHEGGCSIGTNSCGFVTCGPGTTCCHPLYGICTPPGTVCIQ